MVVFVEILVYIPIYDEFGAFCCSFSVSLPRSNALSFKGNCIACDGRAS